MEGSTVLGDAEKQYEPGTAQQRTGVCKGGGMTPGHHTCNRWSNLMPLHGGQVERLRDICELTDGSCRYTNRQTSNTLYEGQANRAVFVPSGRRTPVTGLWVG